MYLRGVLLRFWGRCHVLFLHCSVGFGIVIFELFLRFYDMGLRSFGGAWMWVLPSLCACICFVCFVFFGVVVVSVGGGWFEGLYCLSCCCRAVCFFIFGVSSGFGCGFIFYVLRFFPFCVVLLLWWGCLCFWFVWHFG